MKTHHCALLKGRTNLTSISLHMVLWLILTLCYFNFEENLNFTELVKKLSIKKMGTHFIAFCSSVISALLLWNKTLLFVSIVRMFMIISWGALLQMKTNLFSQLGFTIYDQGGTAENLLAARKFCIFPRATIASWNKKFHKPRFLKIFFREGIFNF